MKVRAAKQPPTRKRSFQLFELLVSLALIALCLFPMLRPHAAMRKADMEYLAAIQLERLSQSAFCAIKEKLYAHNTHSWADLIKGVQGELNESFTVATGKNTSRTYHCTYTSKLIAQTGKETLKKKAMVVYITLDLASEGLHHTSERTLYLEKEQG